jgi:hypothetical protein
MPGKLILEINGTPFAAIPVKLTGAQIRAVVRRFAKRQNVILEGKTEAEIGEAALRRLLRWMKYESLDEQRKDLMDAKIAEIEAILQGDNDLYDEPEPPPRVVLTGT